MTIEEVIRELASIAPNWAKAVCSGILPLSIGGDKKYRIDEFKTCIVGEAWGWTDDYKYRCENCMYYSYAFYALWKEGRTGNEVIDTLKKFIKHYRDKHK